MTRRDAIARICRLQEQVSAYLDRWHQHPADCFCGEGGFWATPAYTEPDFRNDGKSIEFIERVVRVAIGQATPVTDALLGSEAALAAYQRDPWLHRTVDAVRAAERVRLEGGPDARIPDPVGVLRDALLLLCGELARAREREVQRAMAE